MRGRRLAITFLVVFVLGLSVDVLHATVVYPFEVFTSNGAYHDSAALDLYVAVSDKEEQVDFTFYNESLVASSIARIYFDDASLLGLAAITEGPGTSFSQPATPRNLPAGHLLEPLFVTADGLSAGSDRPRSHNGINPGEWAQVTCDLINNATPQDVINKLNQGSLRVGVHIIGLPDCSSESAITVPEPATIFLLGLGSLALLRKRRF